MPFIGVQPAATAITATSLSGVTSSAAELNILDGVTSTAAELNYLDITALGTSQASKVVTADSSGNVGIGATSPSTALEVLSPASGTGALKAQNASGASASTAIFEAVNGGGTTRLLVQNDGNVGIGTTSPADELHVNAASANVNMRLTRDTNTGARISGSDGASTPVIKFDTIASGTATERMRIDSSGNVGIGSASNFSGARVAINDSPPTAFGSPMLQIGQETFVGNGYYSLGLGYTGSGYTEPPAEIAAVSTSSSGGTTADIVFGTRSVTTNTAVTERMRIISTGVVQFENGLSEKYNAVTSSSNATTVDLRAGTNFSHTLTENTTFTFSNPAASGRVSSFTLKVVQDASASGYTLTWPASVDWAAATAPTLTATANAVDYFVFITHDGGTNWYGFTAGQALG